LFTTYQTYAKQQVRRPPPELNFGLCSCAGSSPLLFVFRDPKAVVSQKKAVVKSFGEFCCFLFAFVYFSLVSVSIQQKNDERETSTHPTENGPNIGLKTPELAL
jgi:hypothetical protein